MAQKKSASRTRTLTFLRPPNLQRQASDRNELPTFSNAQSLAQSMCKCLGTSEFEESSSIGMPQTPSLHDLFIVYTRPAMRVYFR